MKTTIRINSLEQIEYERFSEWEALTEDEKLFRVVYRSHMLNIYIDHKIIFTKKLDHENPNHITWRDLSQHLRVQII